MIVQTQSQEKHNCPLKNEKLHIATPATRYLDLSNMGPAETH